MSARRAVFVAASLLLVLLPVAACASARTRTNAAPSRESLLDFLQRSPDARIIEAAARAEGLLSASESDIEDLEATAKALGIDRIEELAVHVAAVTGEAAMLFAAFDERRRGNRSGDVAHWVAVALLVLDEDDLAEQYLRDGVDWQPDYLDDVLALRRLSRDGALAAAALGEPPPGPELYEVAIAPELSTEKRPVFVATEDRGYWPAFDSAGSKIIAATIALERRRPIEWDTLRVLVRRPGKVTVIAVPEQPQPRFRLADDGTLSPDGTVDLIDGQSLDLLVQMPGASTLAMLEPGIVVELPWAVNCCQLVERGEAEWWVRLAAGDAAGAWVLASSRAFGATYPALDALLGDAQDRTPVLRLGPLRRAGTVDVYGGARLAYWLAGSADEPPLMVLAGGPGWSSRYLREALSETLGANRLLYLYDQRGSGYSNGGDDPALLTIARAVLDLDQMRRATELERLDILGHGFGGLLALHYAITYPDHVDRLVLVDPEPATRASWEAARQRLDARTSAQDQARLEEISSSPGWDSDALSMAAWFSVRMRAYMSDPESARVTMPFDELTLPNYRTTPALMRDSLGDWDLRTSLSLVGSPTLIVAGADSIYLAPVPEIANAIPFARLEILDGSGHFPFYESKLRFAALVDEFLRR